MPHGVLDRATIQALALGNPPLLEEYLSLEEQLQPNGVDLTLRQVARLASAGWMGSAAAERSISEAVILEFDRGGWVSLSPGPYLVTFNEVVNLPLGLMALGRTRSSLLRSGVSLHTAVWDAGYRGRSQSLMVVHHPLGYRLQRGARIMQLVFLSLTRADSQGYLGRFLGENL
ncbi:MAG: deoxyuridine 5'-triphosphate nucleotidohydrolase [SAR202 cluster bacterium]|nr:deoxyuridine 5'-triphosphate nucleotidohydrolase [SAR202 cluster bacterium]